MSISPKIFPKPKRRKLIYFKFKINYRGKPYHTHHKCCSVFVYRNQKWRIETKRIFTKITKCYAHNISKI